MKAFPDATARSIYLFDFTVKEKHLLSNAKTTHESLNHCIADILDQSDEQMSITTNPSKFEGPYDWTASSGGKLTDSCSWTSFPTNTADEKMTFCGDNVGEKVSVKNRAFTACTDSTTITDYCGNGYTYTTGGEKCDDGNSSNSDTCTTSCTLTYCGDKTVQNPNGNGQKEECDDGNTGNNDGCSSTCTKETTPVECDSLQFENTEIIANTQTTLSVRSNLTAVPDIEWIATATGTFNDKNPYNSGSTTSVTFKTEKSTNIFSPTISMLLWHVTIPCK